MNFRTLYSFIDRLRFAAVLSALILGGIGIAYGQAEVEIEEVGVETSAPESSDSGSQPDYTLSGSEKRLIAERIAEWNTPWKKVELSGKVSADGLPVKPTVKIFMENNKKILISVRVVFLGEVARIEVTPDEFLVINKINHTYYKADPRSIIDGDPTIISELQAILLGRIALVGHGEFKADQAPEVEIVQQSPEEFLVVPAEVIAEGAINFGYSVSALGQLEELIGVYSGFDGYVNLSYARAGERLQIIGEIVRGNKSNGATLQFDAPDWEGKGFSKMKLSSDYRQVPFREVLRIKL